MLLPKNTALNSYKKALQFEVISKLNRHSIVVAILPGLIDELSHLTATGAWSRLCGSMRSLR
jgi:hypothetical protein